MKKLMVAACAVALAVVANAGSYSWGFSSDSSMDPFGGGYQGYLMHGTALLFDGIVTPTYNGDGTWSFSGVTGLKQTSQQNEMTGQFGVINTRLDEGWVTALSGQDYTLILTYDNGVTDINGYEGEFFIYSSQSTQGYDPVSEAKWANFLYEPAVGVGDWKTAAAAAPVPEPTSGLLLLLGVAGLALKRKRA